MRRALVVAGILLGSVMAGATPAAAHAQLVSVQASGPDTVVLLFSEVVDLQHSTLAVDGRRQQLRPVGADALAVDLPHGTSEVSWRIVSAMDGHAVTASRLIDPADLSAGQSTQQPADPGAASTHALLATRIAQYLSLVVLVGGLAFLALVWPAGAAAPRARKLLGTASCLGLLTAIVGVGLQQAAVQEVGPTALSHLSTWRDAVDGHVGQVWLARTLVWLLTFPLLRALALQGAIAARSVAWRLGSLVVGVGLVRTIGLTSHGEASAHPVLGGIADLVHILAASSWLGGLAFLLAVVLPRRDADELALVLPRYSRVALGSVVAVIAAGTALSWDLLGSVDALFTTGYGHRLLVKLALVALLLLAAQRSKAFVQQRLDIAVVLGGDSAVLRPLVLSVAAETALAVTVLAAAAVLATGSPVR
jgi:copper transport protein